jgi:CDGSH-type Zn-finger protein
MATDEPLNLPAQIVVEDDGPYTITGGIPVVRKIQLVSEAGEPLAWKVQSTIETSSEYCLCRCGHSEEKPFCDGSHNLADWDGTENAPTTTIAERRVELSKSSKLTIHFDLDLCTESGFCGNRNFSLLEGNTDTEDIQLRTLAIHMIEHCPSGALTYQLPGVTGDIEVDLPKQIAVTTEITAEGAIQGPLWVTGSIPVIRADGQPIETRNRLTLCSCGHSQTKPLCDGAHRAPGMQRCAKVD